MIFINAFGGDLCALGGWTVTIECSRKFGGYLVIVYTFVGGTWKIRTSVFKYPHLLNTGCFGHQMVTFGQLKMH
jgi:hypothetical protein